MCDDAFVTFRLTKKVFLLYKRSIARVGSEFSFCCKLLLFLCSLIAAFVVFSLLVFLQSKLSSKTFFLLVSSLSMDVASFNNISK